MKWVTVSIVCGVLLVIGGVSLTQEHAETIEESQIDEIVVKGPKTRGQIRREIEAAEKQIYLLFNELNTDDDYDILCRRITRTGSQIPETVCRARIYWDALSELTQDDEAMPFAGRPLVDPARHAAVFKQKLIELAKSDPELRRALLKRRQLVQEREGLDKVHEQR